MGDPSDSRTREIVEQIAEAADRRSTHRTITPDGETWRDAGILSGTLAPIQGHGKQQRRRGLNDALMLATARKCGCVVLTRNLDFDLLQQLDPAGRVMFYRTSLP